MAEIRINTTGGLKLYDGDNSHYAQIVAGTITSNVDAITLGHDTVTIADNLSLGSDSAILKLGADGDATLTHDGTTGLTIAATPISIDATGELHLNSTTGDIKLQDGGTDQIAFDLDGTSGEVIMKPAVDSDDLVISQYDGTEVIRIEDNASLGLVGNKLSIANSSSDVVIKPLTDAKDIIFQQYDGTEVARIEDNATFNVSSAGKFAYAGTAVTATAAELNLLDGGTSVGSSITLADADGVVVNDGGTMKTIPASDFATYAGGAMTHLGGSQGTTATAGINLSQVFSNDYVSYYGFFSAAATTTSNSTPRIIFTDSSDNKLTSDYKYAGVEHTGGSGGAGAYFYHSTTDGFLPMHTSSMGNGSNLVTDIHFWLTDITDSGHKPHITWLASGFFHGYDFGWTSGGGAYDAEVAPAGLRFEMANGNVREYNFRLWGLKA